MKDLIENFIPQNQQERASKDKIIALLSALPACLYRDHFNPGHITGSGVLISADGERILLNHHKFLDKWLYFGGHADGEMDIFSAARREVEEESGLTNFSAVMSELLSVDVHPIPENKEKSEPAHHHHDMLFLFQMNEGADETPIISDESTALKWVSWAELKDYRLDEHLCFSLEKARKIVHSPNKACA